MSTSSAHLSTTARFLRCMLLGNLLVAFLFVCALTSCTVQHTPQTVRPTPQNKQEAADLSNTPTSEPRPPQQSVGKAVSDGKSIGGPVFREGYTNPQYGYSVLIPKGFVGKGGVAGGHGISITLSEQPKAHVWISGLYNGDGRGDGGYSSIDEAIDSYLEGIKKDATWLEMSGREPAQLDNLSAVRAIIRYQDQASGQIMIDDSITAFRTVHSEGVSEGIMYAVGLSTPEARYKQDKMIYEKVISSWRARRITE